MLRLARDTAPRCLPPNPTLKAGCMVKTKLPLTCSLTHSPTHYSSTSHPLAHSLLEQDVLGGLACVAYSTSSNPWEAEYCSLWEHTACCQVARLAAAQPSKRGPDSPQPAKSALADSAVFDHLGRLRLPRAGRRREGHRLRRWRGRGNRRPPAWFGARVLQPERDPRPRPGVCRGAGHRLGVRHGAFTRGVRLITPL